LGAKEPGNPRKNARAHKIPKIYRHIRKQTLAEIFRPSANIDNKITKKSRKKSNKSLETLDFRKKLYYAKKAQKKAKKN